MADQTDFLHARSIASVKKDLKNILSSYHHYWDIFSELTQNSRDAILRRKESEKIDGKLYLHVDYATRTVHILDNGTGIAKEEIVSCLAPSGGDKELAVEEIGEKGVGLTFCIFIGNEFVVESRDCNGGEFTATITGAHDWLESDSLNDFPMLELQDDLSSELTVFGNLPASSFTYIRIASIRSRVGDPDIFDMSPDQLRFMLQTRTVVGDLGGIFDDKHGPIFEFNLSYKLKGELGDIEESEVLEAIYPRLHEFLKKAPVELSTAEQKLAAMSSTKKKLNFLKDRCVYSITTRAIQGRTINVYGIMFPGNTTFSELSRGERRLEFSDENLNKDFPLFKSGIYIGTKGMPTGIEIKEGDGCKYPAYYKRCFFVAHDNDLAFDMGRKTIHHIPRRRLQEAVTEIFKRFEEIAKFQPGGSAKASVANKTKAQRQREIEEDWKIIEKIEDLACAAIPCQKIPDGQEAGVVAIFHELLGAGQLTKYRPLKSGYGTRYDLYSYYDGDSSQEKIILEFKYVLESVCDDFQNITKFFNEIDILVAWDADETKLEAYNLSLEECNPDEDEVYEGVNYLLESHDFQDPIPVILLKDFIETLEDEL